MQVCFINMSMKLSTIYPFLFVLLIASCTGRGDNKGQDRLARVEDQYLTLQEVRNNVPGHLLTEDSLYALRQYRENWIKRQLLLKEARRLKLENRPEVQKRLAKAREEVLVQALKDYVTSQGQDQVSVSDKEARVFYQANKQHFVLDEDFVRFRHLTTYSIGDARTAKQELLQGVSWKEVAQKYAVNADKALQESEQYWPISMAAQEIHIMNRYLKIIGQNEISPIQRVNGVYHFVQLLDERAEGEHPDLNWLINHLKDWMVLNKNQRNFSSFLKNLYLEAKSNNELELFNVTTSKQENILSDTLEHTSPND